MRRANTRTAVNPIPPDPYPAAPAVSVSEITQGVKPTADPNATRARPGSGVRWPRDPIPSPFPYGEGPTTDVEGLLGGDDSATVSFIREVWAISAPHLVRCRGLQACYSRFFQFTGSARAPFAAVPRHRRRE